MSNWDYKAYFSEGDEVVTWINTKVKIGPEEQFRVAHHKPRLERKKIKSSNSRGYKFDISPWKLESNLSQPLEEIHRLNLPIGSKVIYQGKYYEIISLEIYPFQVCYDLINPGRTQTLPGIYHDQIEDLVIWGKSADVNPTTKGKKIGKVVI